MTLRTLSAKNLSTTWRKLEDGICMPRVCYETANNNFEETVHKQRCAPRVVPEGAEFKADVRIR